MSNAHLNMKGVLMGVQANQEEIEQAILDMGKKNTESMGKLFELTKAAMYGYILSIIKNPHDAEDILQNTYIRIYDNAHMYLGKGKPLAWMFTIARNMCLMKMREQKHTTPISEEEWQLYYDENPYMSVEDKIVISKALTTLSDEEAQIVTLHAVTGLKHREIAKQMGLSLPTVLSKYSRAVKKLQKQLE